MLFDGLVNPLESKGSACERCDTEQGSYIHSAKLLISPEQMTTEISYREKHPQRNSVTTLWIVVHCSIIILVVSQIWVCDIRAPTTVPSGPQRLSWICSHAPAKNDSSQNHPQTPRGIWLDMIRTRNSSSTSNNDTVMTKNFPQRQDQ